MSIYFKYPTDWGILPPNDLARKISLLTWLLEHTTPVQSQKGISGIFPLHDHPDVSDVFSDNAVEKSHIATVSESTVGENDGATLGFTVGLPVG